MLRQTRSSRRRGTRILTDASAYAVERLEPRRLLATLNVSGTGSHDVIEVDVRLDGFIHVTINGDHNVHNAFQYSDILVKASSGNDTIHVPRNFGRQVTVDGDLGDDTLWVGGGNFGDFIDVPVWFDDVDGLDALVIDDRNGGGGESYSMYNSGAGTFHGFRENDFFLDDEIRWHN